MTLSTPVPAKVLVTLCIFYVLLRSVFSFNLQQYQADLKAYADAGRQGTCKLVTGIPLVDNKPIVLFIPDDGGTALATMLTLAPNTENPIDAAGKPCYIHKDESGETTTTRPGVYTEAVPPPVPDWATLYHDCIVEAFKFMHMVMIVFCYITISDGFARPLLRGFAQTSQSPAGPAPATSAPPPDPPRDDDMPPGITQD